RPAERARWLPAEPLVFRPQEPVPHHAGEPPQVLLRARFGAPIPAPLGRDRVPAPRAAAIRRIELRSARRLRDPWAAPVVRHHDPARRADRGAWLELPRHHKCSITEHDTPSGPDRLATPRNRVACGVAGRHYRP